MTIIQIAPFVCQAFSSPEFVRACSDAAGKSYIAEDDIEANAGRISRSRASPYHAS